MNLKKGYRVGNWTLISNRFKDHVHFFKCICICGTKRNVREWHLKHNKTKSCGCTNIVGRFKYHGYNDLSLSYFNSFKKNRLRKKIQFDNKEITLQYLWKLFIKQNKKCALSGVDIVLDSKWSSKVHGSKIQTASIDRIDNKKGYIKGNIQWLHKDINLMKGSLNDEKFIKYCKHVANNFKTKKL